MTPTFMWLIAGVLLVIAETVGVSGIGLIFIGLGALVTGAAMQLGYIAEENTVLQFIVCFAATALWAVALWKVVGRSRLSKDAGYSNMIGDIAIVGGNGLSKGNRGEVTWSGTIMHAELARDAATSSLPAGAQVIITAVKGATLTVIPKE
jgi:membrane protein implicated in regulation of membrane protease activity